LNGIIGNKIDINGHPKYAVRVERQFQYGAAFDVTYGKYRLTVSHGHHCEFTRVRTNRRHVHEHYHELCFITGGSGIFIHNRKQYALGPGDVCVADPGARHEIESFRTADLTLVFFTLTIDPSPAALSERFADDVLHRFSGRHVSHRRNVGVWAVYRPLLEAPAGMSYRRRRAAESLLVEALTTMSCDPPPEEGGEGRLLPPIERALEYIDSRLDRPLRAAEVAARACTSERNLRRLFRDAFGHSLSREMGRRRMTYAGHLLASHIPVAEAAVMVGIDDPSQFSRVFKRQFGVSPKTYQQRYSRYPSSCG